MLVVENIAGRFVLLYIHCPEATVGVPSDVRGVCAKMLNHLVHYLQGVN